MQYRKTNIIIILLFAALVLLPVLKTNTKVDAISEMDNKVLAQNPVKASIGGERFADAVDAYINDRVGFRENIIKLNNRISYFVFHISPTPSVILGENGWLFYNSGSVVEQYTGQARYTEEELQQIVNNLVTTEAYLKERNCEFVLFIAPNKERIYSDYMPSYYKDARVSEQCNTEQVVEYLRENTDIRVVWPYEEIRNFAEQNPDMPLYYHLDTHWNHLGGYLGAKAMLKELGVSMEEPQNLSITQNDSSPRDLYTMLALEPWLNMTDVDYSIDGFPGKDTDYDNTDFLGQWIYVNEGKDPRRVMVNRDSFSSAMCDYIGTEFNYVNLVHTSGFTQDLVDKEKPDIFVYEIVERNDDSLLNFVLQ